MKSLIGVDVADTRDKALIQQKRFELAATAVGYNRIFTAAGATLGPPIFGATVDLTHGYASGWLLTGAIVLTATLLIGLFFRERASGHYQNAIR